MTIFRYKKNGLLYTITTNAHGGAHKVFPYKHDVEIGITYKNGFRDFKSNMSMKDFMPVYYT